MFDLYSDENNHFFISNLTKCPIKSIFEASINILKMYKYLLFAPILFLFGCGGSEREEEETSSEIDKKIQDYCDERGLDAERQESGLYIYVENEGGEQKPNGDSYVTLNYEGYLLDGTLFESTYGEAVPSGIPLDMYISGWQEAIPHFGRGGKGTFIVPPSLGFGEEGKGSIPGNSILVFDIELVDFGLDPPPMPDYSEEIMTYCEMKGLDTSNAIITDSGLFIFIEEEGGEAKPTLDDYITVYFTGWLTDQTKFDGTADEPVTYLLSELIPGWREGVPYIGAGGKCKLIIPPYLGFGANDDGEIPGDSVVIFDIELVDFSASPPEEK